MPLSKIQEATEKKTCGYISKSEREGNLDYVPIFNLISDILYFGFQTKKCFIIALLDQKKPRIFFSVVFYFLITFELVLILNFLL